MLSNEEKNEMLLDAKDLKRKEAFAQARHRSLQPMSWLHYFQFLNSLELLFPSSARPHKITGSQFKL